MARHTSNFDANKRLVDATKALAFISDTLSTKGFLGPSLRENRGLPSVGVSSARRAGVIVDENGKMRCPPGTPNANQFTDINMSNCMVPSAETAARNAAEVAADAARQLGGGFKRGTNSRKDVTPVDMGIGTSDSSGRLTVKRVAVGAQVVMPESGEEVTLDNVDDSVEFVRQGGSLTDVPDEHVINAIELNTGQYGRFSYLDRGDGVNGMIQYEDRTNGRKFGVKYFGGYGTMRQSPDEEQLNELVGEIVSEEFGFEPVPMRLVSSKPTADGSGVSLVSELVFNRSGDDVAHHDGVGSATGYDNKSLAAMRVMDEVLENVDRHDRNYLIGKNDSGQETFIPIDHSLIADRYSENMDITPMNRAFINPHIEQLMDEIDSDPDLRDELTQAVTELQERLLLVNLEELEERISAAVAHVASITRDPNFDEQDEMERFRRTIERINTVRSMDPDDLTAVVIGKREGFGQYNVAGEPMW